MGLAEILSAIDAAGEAEIAAIEAGFQERLAALEETGGTRLEITRDTARQRAAAPAAAMRAQLLQKAKLDAVRIIGEAREEAVGQIMTQARTALSRVRARPAYPHLLAQLLEEAVAAVHPNGEPPQGLIVLGDPRDRETLVLRARDYDLRLTLHCAGGVIVHSQDEKITIDNTLESRFERAAPALRLRLAAHLDQLVDG